MLKIGLVGYGGGGRWFHAPFIAAAEGVELAGVVARSPEKIALVEQDYPGLPVYPSLTAMLDAGVDAVTITTPPETRRELVLEAIAAGVHVVADKPFAPSAEAARELGRAADEAGVRLSVYHQRRNDSDIKTLKTVLDSGELGQIWRFNSIFDLDEPETLEAGPHGGLLRDLGSHLVDQALWLFGPALRVNAHLDWVELEQGRTDAGFVVQIDHESVSAYLSASKLNRVQRRTLEVYAENGSYVSQGVDIQAQQVKTGMRPGTDGWGMEPTPGVISLPDGKREVPSNKGDYSDYYSAFANAVETGGEVPVPVAQAVQVLEVLDAARVSAAEHRVVELA
ncbi:MAG: Gfo/Idh/MocA family oxidoreductase [Propionibacteriaceae bacterium]|jgi:predicted dehydrogenase|nr:Gfo/Idh/MocA family oxidoreductase [Propionibacteriaceae bacterium]